MKMYKVIFLSIFLAIASFFIINTPKTYAHSCDIGSIASYSASELLNIVPTADYYCTEAIAQVLAPIADESTIQNLLSIVDSNAEALARRNAIRIIGRFAGLTSSSPAHILVTSTKSSEVKASLLSRLQNDQAGNVLEDAIWVLDSYFFPYPETQIPLQQISGNTEQGSSVRFRAIAAVARLYYYKSGLISTEDLNYLLQSIASDDYWVRAEAAYIVLIVSDNRYDEFSRSQLLSALQSAYNSEPQIAAKVYQAKALDRFNGNTALYDSLKSSFEAEHLPNSLTGNNVTLKSGLPNDQLAALLTLLQNEQNAFSQIMGSAFSSPLPGESSANVTIVIFATQQEYIDYMGSFIGYAAYAGGLYIEDTATLYTYQRTSSQSTYTLEELLKHEFAHYLQGLYIYPGSFSTPTYFSEPKAWIDEGTAEYYGGMVFDSSGNYSTPLRQNQLTRICASPYRNLQSLLSQTEGYSDPGVFDYDNGWAFIFYLNTNRQDVIRNLYTSFRNNSYHLSNFANIAGVSSINTLQSDWHAAMQTWCTTGTIPSPTPGPSASPSLMPTPTPSSSPTPTPDTTPPTVSITSPASGSTVSGIINVQVQAADNTAVSRVEIIVPTPTGYNYITDASAPYSTLWDTATVSNGPSCVYAYAYDLGGLSSTAQNCFTINNADTQPPSNPASLNATATAYNNVNLSWSASTDNRGVSGYWVIRNGITITSVNGTSYADTSVSANTNYQYKVQAFDAAGNASGFSNTASVTTPQPPDTQAPSTPSNLRAQVISSSQINLTWNASTDNVGVIGYEVYRNNNKVATVTTASYGDTGLAASTTYSYFIKALDAAGNKSNNSNTVTPTTQAVIIPGTISGVVSSSKGGPVAGAKVAIVVNGSTKNYTADSAGSYTIPGLSAGTYSVTYSATGYQMKTLSIRVNQGQTIVQDVTLKKN